MIIPEEDLKDNYSIEILNNRYNTYRKSYLEVENFKKLGINIRHQNPPEDITENIVKFIIRKYDNEPNIIWSKGIINKKYKISGDLYSNNFNPEIKSFTSNGPMQFSPTKNFDVLYCLDMRNWIDDKLILWKIDISSSSEKYLNIKVNKNETIKDQIKNKRRPHINFNYFYQQVEDYSTKIFENSFTYLINN
jgi:hypothetical protein